MEEIQDASRFREEMRVKEGISVKVTEARFLYPTQLYPLDSFFPDHLLVCEDKILINEREIQKRDIISLSITGHSISFSLEEESIHLLFRVKDVAYLDSL